MITSINLKEDNRQKENSQVIDKIVAFLFEQVSEDNIEIFKNWGSGVGKSGRADLEIMYNANTWYVEGKDPKGRLSNIQRKRIEKAKRIGITVYVVKSLEQFKKEVWPVMNR